MFSGTGFYTKDGKPAIIYHGQGSGRNWIQYPLDDHFDSWSDPEPVLPKAADAFKKAAELSPRDADSLYYAGETAFMADRKAEAKDFLERFLKVESTTQRADVAKVLLDEL